MYRNLYDTDTITWSPQGRLFQVEYAMEAVKQGTCCVALRSKTHAVLVCLKRAVSKLAESQEKIIKVHDHIGLALSGITADAKVLAQFMRTECLHHQYTYDKPIFTKQLISKLAEKCQLCTQKSSSRPYGVGLLVASYDEQGPHIYECCPSGLYNECWAASFGARSQSGRTYLEKHFERFEDCTVDELIRHGLTALRQSLPPDTSLTSKTVSIGVVGVSQDFTALEVEDTEQHIERLSGTNPATGDVVMEAS